MKKTIIIVVVLILIGIGAYFSARSFSDNADIAKNQGAATTTPSTNEQPTDVTDKGQSVIGRSVEGREIVAYHYLPAQAGQASSTGDTELLFIGGIHGGYEWNTVLVAYELMDYLKKNPAVVPSNVRVTVIPVLNPDGLYKVVGTTSPFSQGDVPSVTNILESGRFNAHTVDLNRNFDCDWQTTGKWQNKDVSGGSAAFSEPESQAVKNYIEVHRPSAVIVWYSSAGGVFASSCHNGVSAETRTLTQKYAVASGYPAYESFDFYEITGDMVNWLAKNNIPAISVLLTNHTDTEWAKNQKGIDALLKYYAK